MSTTGFLLGILRRKASEDETRVSSAQKEIGTRRRSSREAPAQERQLRGFTVERAAEIIDELPSDVPRESALRIVRRTLAAAGVEVGDLDRSTRAQLPKLSSQIELARNRQNELWEKTEEVIHSLEAEVRKARENYEAIFAEEEREISRASKGLEYIKRTRAFFGLDAIQAEETIGSGGEDA
jgi:hypothetical protein